MNTNLHNINILTVGVYSSNGNSAKPEAEKLIKLNKKGIKVDVLMPSDDFYEKKFKENNIKVHIYRRFKPYNKDDIKFLRNLIIKENYKIVYLLNSKAATAGVLGTKGLNVALIAYRGYTGHLVWYKPTAYLNYFNNKVCRIVAVADGVKNQVKKNLLWNKNKVVTIYKGHDVDWYKDITPVELSKFDIPNNSFVVMLVANARKMKGIKYFIDSMRYLKDKQDIHFVLVGDKINRNPYLSQIKKLDAENRIHILGFQDNPIEFMAAADVIVLASIMGEGLSRTTIESMSQERPVIATNIGGNAELVINEKTGLLIPPRNAKAIANGIIKLKENPEFAQQLGKNAKRHIIENINVNRTVKETIDLFSEIVDEYNF